MLDLTYLGPGGCPCDLFPDCVCTPTERVLRLYAGGQSMPVMSTAQREECLEEIHHVEGYDRTDYEGATDQDLARGVLHAWVDYCRDKGVL